MALTKSSTLRAVQASTSNAAAATTTTSGQTIGYGVSGVAKITNGATGPTLPCSVRADFSADGINWVTGQILGYGDTASSAVVNINYGFGPGGGGGDWNQYRLVFTGNTAQSVTVEASDSTVSAL